MWNRADVVHCVCSCLAHPIFASSFTVYFSDFLQFKCLKYCLVWFHMLTCQFFQFPAAFLFVCFLQLYCRIKGNKYVIHKQGDSAIKWPCEHRTVPCNIRYKYKKKKQNKWKRYIYKDISNNIFQFPSNIWQRMFFCCKFTFVNVTF